MLITAETRVGQALEAHPNLKPILISLSPRFKKLNNRAIFKMVGQWARMRDVARIGGLSICELLYTLNRELGQTEEMSRRFPECIQETATPPTQPPDWFSTLSNVPVKDVRGRDDFFLPEIQLLLDTLAPDAAIEVVNAFDPAPLKAMAESDGLLHHTEERGVDEIHVTFYRPAAGADSAADTGPATATGRPAAVDRDRAEPEGRTKRSVPANQDDRVSVVLQSATPVVWPVLVRMLESDRLMTRMKFDEVKVWDKTEKHLGWMVQGKADISFSAVVAATRLFTTGKNIKMVSVDVWDNFYVLSRDGAVKRLEDLKGRRLQMPLIKTAPPAAVTNYLLRANGLDPSDFEFAFGDPFGRPDDIKNGFIAGTYDTVLLREPEASFALEATGGDSCACLSFQDLWQKLHPESGDLPNAGLVFKGEFLEQHPKEANLFQEELDTAITWVTTHQEEAADRSWKIMGHSKQQVAAFLAHVHLEHRPASQAKDAVAHYLEVLANEGGMKIKGGLEAAMAFFEP